jgi:hypothetical protein
VHPYGIKLINDSPRRKRRGITAPVGLYAPQAAGYWTLKENKLYKELAVYELEKAWVLQTPLPRGYAFWWPWLKNFGGWPGNLYQSASNTHYYWIDQKLKTKMLGN